MALCVVTKRHPLRSYIQDEKWRFENGYTTGSLINIGPRFTVCRGILFIIWEICNHLFILIRCQAMDRYTEVRSELRVQWNEWLTTTRGVTKPTVVLLHLVVVLGTERSVESRNAVQGSHCLINTHFTSGHFNELCEAPRGRGGGVQANHDYSEPWFDCSGTRRGRPTESHAKW